MLVLNDLDVSGISSIKLNDILFDIVSQNERSKFEFANKIAKELANRADRIRRSGGEV